MRHSYGPQARTIVSAAVVAVLTLLTCTAVRSRADTPDQRFLAGQSYRGEFADPSVLRVGATYWAYATVTGGDNLPAMHSTDLRTWYARGSYPVQHNPGWWAGYNDALPHPAPWAVYDVRRNGREFTRPWAPSVAAVGSGFVLAYSVPISTTSARRCITIATSRWPAGPFHDASTTPLTCSADPGGSIDPQVLRPGNGRTYLVWKNAGVPGRLPTRVWVRELDAAATAFAAGSRAHLLLQTSQAWERNVVENPAMIYFHQRYYLFYSGANYAAAAYATGYAVCSGPLGPCHKPRGTPLLATGGSVAGPGGATPIVDASGRLRLAYAAWDLGHVGYQDQARCTGTAYGCNHRRLHVATLTVTSAGTLGVAARG